MKIWRLKDKMNELGLAVVGLVHQCDMAEVCSASCPFLHASCSIRITNLRPDCTADKLQCQIACVSRMCAIQLVFNPDTFRICNAQDLTAIQYNPLLCSDCQVQEVLARSSLLGFDQGVLHSPRQWQTRERNNPAPSESFLKGAPSTIVCVG